MIIYFISRWRLYPRFLSALMLFWFLSVCFCYSCCFKLYHYHMYCFWMSQLALILVIFADFYVYKSHYLYVSIGGVVFCFSLIFHQVCTSYMYQEKSLDMLIMNCFIRGEIFFRPFILYLKRSNVVEPCLSKVPCVGFIIIRSCCSSTKVAYLKVSYQVIFLFFIFL